MSAPIASAQWRPPVAGYFFCSVDGSAAVTTWFQKTELLYEYFFAAFLSWYMGCANQYTDLGDSCPDEASAVVKVLRQWLTNANHLITGMEWYHTNRFVFDQRPLFKTCKFLPIPSVSHFLAHSIFKEKSACQHNVKRQL